MRSEAHSVTPWHRQFWPWFVISLVGSAVAASLFTVWIAVGVAPERVDYAGSQSVEVSLDSQGLEFDLGLAPEGSWPQSLQVTITTRDNDAEQYEAYRIDARRFRIDGVAMRPPGSYDIAVRAPGAATALRGNWAYPAPVWKLRPHDE